MSKRALSIGERLRRARIQQRVSLRELGRRTGFSPAQLSDIARGLVNPDLETRMLIMTALVLRAPSLAEGSGNDGA